MNELHITEFKPPSQTVVSESKGIGIRTADCDWVTCAIGSESPGHQAFLEYTRSERYRDLCHYRWKLPWEQILCEVLTSSLSLKWQLSQLVWKVCWLSVLDLLESELTKDPQNLSTVGSCERNKIVAKQGFCGSSETASGATPEVRPVNLLECMFYLFSSDYPTKRFVRWLRNRRYATKEPQVCYWTIAQTHRQNPITQLTKYWNPATDPSYLRHDMIISKWLILFLNSSINSFNWPKLPKSRHDRILILNSSISTRQ
jgi:hypothetical protein